MSKYEVFSGPYFPAFGLITERYRVSPYSVRMWKNMDLKKLCIWTLFTQCTFHIIRLIFHNIKYSISFYCCHINERVPTEWIFYSEKLNYVKSSFPELFKHTQTICRLLSTNCLSVIDHFVGLALKGLTFAYFSNSASIYFI